MNERAEQLLHLRQGFKALLAENPNYFGTVLDPDLADSFSPVFSMQENQDYEQLWCVGLYPEDNLLEAVIEIKLPYGFKGDLCDRGSKEYIAFYIDYGDGFVSVGPPAEVNVHDIAYVEKESLWYAVRRAFRPEDYWPCERPQVVQVRAILSWDKPPTGPNYPPVWGNVVNRWVQIKPKAKGATLIPVGSLVPGLASLEAEPSLPAASEKLILMGSKQEIQALLDASAEDEPRSQAAAEVQPERAKFEAIMTANPNYFGSICASQDPKEILEAVYQLAPQVTELLLPQLEINPDFLIPVAPMPQSEFYEELTCVGLYPEEDLLEAIIEIKRPYGYNGNLCAIGSKEHVAFYVDWGDGVGYQHVGTTSVRVHNIPQAGDESIFYAVRLYIQDVDRRLQKCSTENIVSVRAILSWKSDPTPFGPTWDPPWGNELTRKVQIRPGSGASAKCNIELVNRVLADQISQAGSDRGLAVKITSSEMVPGTHDRPFGGTIACWGNINVPSAAYYRFRYRKDAPGERWHNIRDPRRYSYLVWFTGTRTPDGEGWFSRTEYKEDKDDYSLLALVHWNSRGLDDGRYVLRLELADDAKNPLPAQTCDVAIVLDNTGIDLKTFGGTPRRLPAKGVVVKDTAGAPRECGLFEGDELIRIFGNFRDDYFGGFGLTVFGGNIDTRGKEVAKGRYDGHAALNDRGIIGARDNGAGREIATLNLCDASWHTEGPAVRCAYGIELRVSDRAIVGRLSRYEWRRSGHSARAFVTFNWDPADC